MIKVVEERKRKPRGTVPMMGPFNQHHSRVVLSTNDQEGSAVIVVSSRGRETGKNEKATTGYAGRQL